MKVHNFNEAIFFRKINVVVKVMLFKETIPS